MGHWFLALLPPLRQPASEEAACRPPISEANKDETCPRGVSGSAALCHTRGQGQGPGPGAAPSHRIFSATPGDGFCSLYFIEEETESRNREMTGQGRTARDWNLSLLVPGQELVPEVGVGAWALVTPGDCRCHIYKPLKV